MGGCETREEAGFVIVGVSGEVDLSWSSDVRKAVLAALRKANKVLVDLSQVSYIDSSGVAALVEGFQTARGESKNFALLAISEPVRAVLELARLDQVFPIYSDLEAAAAA